MRHLMKTRRIIGVAVAVSTLAVPAVAVLGIAGQASAASPDHATVKCRTLAGNAGTGTATISNCTASTSGGSGSLSSFVPAGGDVAWANGTTTDYTSTVQPQNTTFPCPSGTSQFNLKGSVTSSTNASVPVGATVKMVVCFNMSNEDLTNAPGSKIKF